MAIELKRVASSHVWRIGFDEATGTLAVQYHPTVKHPAGRVVHYHGVSAEHAAKVLSAPSVGGALHAYIKRGGYKFSEPG